MGSICSCECIENYLEKDSSIVYYDRYAGSSYYQEQENMKNFSNISIDTSGFGPATPASFNSFSGNTGLTPISISFNSGTINANTFAGNIDITDNGLPR